MVVVSSQMGRDTAAASWTDAVEPCCVSENADASEVVLPAPDDAVPGSAASAADEAGEASAEERAESVELPPQPANSDKASAVLRNRPAIRLGNKLFSISVAPYYNRCMIEDILVFILPNGTLRDKNHFCTLRFVFRADGLRMKCGRHSRRYAPFLGLLGPLFF